jgi:hypothetical protein
MDSHDTTDALLLRELIELGESRRLVLQALWRGEVSKFHIRPQSLHFI